MEFGLTCQKCGGHEIIIADEPTDDSIVVCASCGVEHCTLGALRQATLNLAARNAEEQLKKGVAEGIEAIDGIEFQD